MFREIEKEIQALPVRRDRSQLGCEMLVYDMSTYPQSHSAENQTGFSEWNANF